jgi:2-oxoglutarate dehydrogenase complex dehydrogenase (E1) component-like enzyme
MVEAPIIHVNGDDPEAVVYGSRTYRWGFTLRKWFK